MPDHKEKSARLTSSDTCLPSSKRRKNIPGPLGFLPKHKSNLGSTPNRKYPSICTDTSFCDLSDCDLSVSKSSTIWDQVVSLFGSESWKIINDYTVDKILKNAEKNFPCGKIPVFCATIKKIDAVLPIAKAVLRDETGEIGCSIDKTVIQKYRRFLCEGAILILKQISLFSLNQKTFYLNITSSNISKIFLDESHADLRPTSSRIAEEVAICGPNFPLVNPPFSVTELRTLVAECLTSPSASPPSTPLTKGPGSLVSTEGASCSSIGTFRQLTPLRLRNHLPQQDLSGITPGQKVKNGRSNGSRPGLIASAPPASLPEPNSPGLAPWRHGIRSLLRSNANTRPLTSPTLGALGPVPKDDVATTSFLQVPKPVNIVLNNKEDEALDNSLSMPSDWMEDDMDNLLANMLE